MLLGSCGANVWGWPDPSGLGFFDWSGLWFPYQAHAFPGGAVAKHSLSAGALPFLPQPVDKLSGFEATLFDEVATDELDEVAAGLDKENGETATELRQLQFRGTDLAEAAHALAGFGDTSSNVAEEPPGAPPEDADSQVVSRNVRLVTTGLRWVHRCRTSAVPCTFLGYVLGAWQLAMRTSTPSGRYEKGLSPSCSGAA